MLSSSTERIPYPVRKQYALEVLSQAKAFVRTDEKIEERARLFLSLGIKPLDALHLASAEAAQVDYFCTSDDRFLKRARAVADIRTRAVSPLELIAEVMQ